MVLASEGTVKTLLFEDVRIEAITAKAVLLVIEEGTREQWVPLSCIDLDETDIDLEKGAEGTVAVAEWFCNKEEMSP